MLVTHLNGVHVPTCCMSIYLLPTLHECFIIQQNKRILSGHSKRRPIIGVQDRLSLNAGQKYCRMLQESIPQDFRPSLGFRLS